MLKLLCILISVFCFTVSSFSYEKNVDSQCGHTVYVTSATKLKLESYMLYNLGDTCEITLTAYDYLHTGLSLEGHFLDFDLPCTDGSVTIYDSTNKQTRTVLADGLCGYKPSTFYKGSSHSIVIQINRNTEYSQYTGSFNFLLTESHDGYCEDDTEFQCDNFECIYNLLICDGNNNCGDNSDEGCFWTVGAITGFSIGGGVLLMIIVIIIAVSCRRNQRVIYNNQSGKCMPYANGPQVIAQPYTVMRPPQYSAGAVLPPPPAYQLEQSTC